MEMHEIIKLIIKALRQRFDFKFYDQNDIYRSATDEEITDIINHRLNGENKKT